MKLNRLDSRLRDLESRYVMASPIPAPQNVTEVFALSKSILKAVEQHMPIPKYRLTPFLERQLQQARESEAWANPKGLKYCGKPQWNADAHDDCTGKDLLCVDGSWRDVPGIEDLAGEENA